VIEHPARILWTSAETRGTLRLPSTLRYVQPAHFSERHPGDDLWSVVCRFDVPPSEQGSPSVAYVRFLVAEAPHDRLCPGAKFQLVEGTTHVATVEVLG
jgi:hypothetical protein